MYSYFLGSKKPAFVRHSEKKTIPQYQFVLDQRSDISKLDLDMTQTQWNYRLVKGILLYRSRTGSVICCLISTFRNNYRPNLCFIDILFSNVRASGEN